MIVVFILIFIDDWLNEYYNMGKEFIQFSTALRCDSFSELISKKSTCAIMIRIIATFAN